jgi:L-fuculose-phosphate aldolase
MTTLSVPAVAKLSPQLSPHAELAILARALDRMGFDDYMVGHMTYRQPDDTLLTLPLELGWDEVTASDVIRIDESGHILEGRWTVTPAIVLHLEFHRVHPGCKVTIHQHPRYGTIWSTTGRIPPAYDQRSCALSDKQIAVYDDYEGPVDNLDATRAAVAAIGDANCALLRNHGVFLVGDSIEQSYSNAVALEWRCRQAWLAERIEGARTVPEQGRRMVEEYTEAIGGIAPGLWEWAVRRELGPPGSVID